MSIPRITGRDIRDTLNREFEWQTRLATQMDRSLSTARIVSESMIKNRQEGTPEHSLGLAMQDDIKGADALLRAFGEHLDGFGVE
jgi:hypothetical protein